MGRSQWITFSEISNHVKLKYELGENELILLDGNDNVLANLESDFFLQQN